MIMKKVLILLTLCCAAVACKKNDVSFSYSPQNPRAGQVVTFSNLSSTGEEWEWTFGDGGTSTLKSPSHTFKQPGEYDVILKVDKKNRWTAYKKIVVTDTVPTFVCSDTAFYIFRDYTFTANLYNPYNYTVNYTWYLGDTIAAKDQPSLKYCFTHPAEAEKVKLVVILNQDTTIIERSIRIQNRTTNSVLLRTARADYRQRIFGDQAEAYAEDETASDILNAEQDTLQFYNGYEFRLSGLKTVFPQMEGFHIANRKIYYRANGLWVANIDGAYPVQIDASPCAAMTLDTKDNRIYWANSEGVWYMPFVGSDNNKFVTTPILLNSLKEVTKIAADSDLK